MNKNKLISNIVFVLVILLTVATSAFAANELFHSINYNKIKLNGIKSVKKSDGDTNTSISKENALNSQESNDKCYIVINGNTYDVTTFRYKHSGGDIFVCNTDMTEKFNSMHGTNYSLIKRFLVTDSSIVVPNGSNLTNSSVINTASQNNMTLAQLSTHNKVGNCYVAYKGIIYNVSNNPAWTNCTHNGMVGGTDITSKFPHPLSYLSTLPVVGVLSDTVKNQEISNVSKKNEEKEHDDDKLKHEKEYEKEYEFEFED